MTRIRANRESIDDRFSVLGFTVNADHPLYEVGLATDPELFKPEHRARRTAGNFFASPLQPTRPRSDAVYLVPPAVVARFVGQPRLYFGVASYADGDRSKPISVRRPDSGHMYVSLRGLTERGLRRVTRGATPGNGAQYGAPAAAPTWGGDAVADGATPTRGGNGSSGATPVPYNDGYSDDLWQQPPSATAPSADAAPTPAPTADAGTGTGTAPAATQSVRLAGNGAPRPQSSFAAHRDDYDDGFGPMPTASRASTVPRSFAPSRHATPRTPAPSRLATPARELRVVSSYYSPSDWLDALRTQIGFFASSLQWWAGVENTTVMPHSAICQARTVDGSAEGGQHGTAFFIAPNLLLTAAHVVDRQSELIIVPGKNGAGTGAANEPFGRFRVSAADMVKHPSYVASSRDFDIALIRVPSGHASTNYFDLVEELTQSRPEGVVVSGYAAYSDPDGLIDSVVNATIDADRQHMHGGHIRSLPSEETFDYDLQSLGGTSGSPVYYIEDGDAPRTHMVGVHVAGHGDTTNLGCRITPAKLAWIRQQAAAWNQPLSFSLGARALSDAGDASDEEAYAQAELYAHVPEPVEDDGAVAEAQTVRARALTTATPDYPGASRFVPAHSRNFRAGRRRGAVIDRIVIHITAGGPRIDGTIAWFQDGERRDRTTGRQAGPSSAHYIVGRDGEVVQMVRDADTAYHASSANSRSIGIEHNANKPYRLNRRDLPPTMEQYQASAHLVAWLCAQHGIPADREHIVGHIEATPADNHDCPSSYWDWDTYMQCVQLAVDAFAQGSSTGQVPTTSQALSRRPMARAQEIIQPYYDPSDPATALQCQNNAFSQAMEEWFVGVDSTHAFPHSAICHLQMWDSEGNDAGAGTGFYIGPNRILTCGHNLVDAASVTITPGMNGAGVKPFGDCTVTDASWRVPRKYRDNRSFDNDIAVIDNVPIAAPGGAWFRFLQATPSAHMPLVVCGYSAQSRAVPDLTAAIDGYKQHLHGGYAREMHTHETIDYPILSLAGASGSPVYTLRDDGDGLQAYVCAIHVSGQRAAQGVNTGCFITPRKIDYIEDRATTFALGAPRALSTDAVEHRVALVPQPDKNACWAAAMTMLKSFRSDASFDPEAFVREAGGSLATSYGWDQLERVRDHYGFRVIEQPSNASLYHAPTQWAQWLRDFGPLWVVIVGAPHAVVVSGIRGDLAGAAATEVYVLNPWDTTTAFDNDPVAFNPPNRGHEGWMSFEAFAADFGGMAEPDYGNWRVLHLPATAAQAQAQSLSTRGYRLAPAPRSLSISGDAPEPIEPSRVPGTRMTVVRGTAGASRWSLDQLEGRKAPQSPPMSASSLQATDVVIDLGEWPALEGEPAPLPLTVRFRGEADGSIGNVVITAGTPTPLGYGVDVVARIDDAADSDGVATLRVGIDVRFSGLAQGAPTARIDLRLRGDGRYERSNRWTDTSLAA
ncbi:N-acetylmuramoyl-L-alanine amidase [Lysobacter humi (ex Lee et al. 2017)]